jgi:NCS1 family nucleobase:cation symporter-1
MVLYTFVGIAVTSASAVLFGHPIWNPILLIGAFHQPFVAFIALIAILIATLNVNIGANVVSPSNDFSNLYPRLISFRTGGLITGFLGLRHVPVEAAGHARRLHLRLARRLLGPARARSPAS